jgi:hypothetical protein
MPGSSNSSSDTAMQWRRVGSLAISGTSLCIADSWAMPYDALFVRATNGVYTIDVQQFAHRRRVRIARLRARLQGSVPSSSERVAEVDIDVASVAIGDGDALERFQLRAPGDCESWSDSLSDYVASVDARSAGMYPCRKIRSKVAYAETGFGDGIYDVHALLQGRRRVGLEIIFINDNGKAQWSVT